MDQPYREYEKHEFCLAMRCPWLTKGECQLKPGCIYSARSFHKWLKSEGFKTIKYKNVAEDYVKDLRWKNERLLEALKMAYRKHHCNDDTIGWHELSDIMSCVLPDVIGDSEFCAWVDSLGNS